MKTALLFDPYLDTLGGGERYFFTFALALQQYGYKVEIAWNNKEILVQAETRFGLVLNQLEINTDAYINCSKKTTLLERFKFTSNFDLIFWISDGSLPFLFSKNNLVHFQVPFTQIGGNSIINLIKILFINFFVYNSKFTSAVLEKKLGKSKSYILYPPIDVNQFSPGKKKKMILSVARFDSPSHSKRQDVLIRAFRELSLQQNNYELCLAGGLKSKDYKIEVLNKLAKGLPIKIVINPSFDIIKKLYAEAQFFWHAAGYGVNEYKHPENVEHFGMTTVESMSAGCVPIVINKGGQKEIVSKGTGILVEDISGLVKQTVRLIKDNELVESYKKSAIKRSKLYSIEAFNKKINSLI